MVRSWRRHARHINMAGFTDSRRFTWAFYTYFSIDGRRWACHVRTQHVDGPVDCWSLDLDHWREHRPLHADRMGRVAGSDASPPSGSGVYHFQYRVYGLCHGRHGRVWMGGGYNGSARESSRNRVRAPLHGLPRLPFVPPVPEPATPSTNPLPTGRTRSENCRIALGRAVGLSTSHTFTGKMMAVMPPAGEERSTRCDGRPPASSRWQKMH